MTVADLQALFDYGSWANHKLFDALGQLTPEQFTKNVDGPFRHAANHGVHHRGQVSLLIRALGYAPGNIDLLFYEGSS